MAQRITDSWWADPAIQRDYGAFAWRAAQELERMTADPQSRIVDAMQTQTMRDRGFGGRKTIYASAGAGWSAR